MTCTHAATEVADACIEHCPICQLAEIERMREALKEISELGPDGEEQPCDPLAAGAEGDKDFNLYDQGFCEAWRRAGNIARVALTSH